MKKVASNRCAAKTKAGKPCQAAPTEGGLCFFHANPNKASELGRIGGTKKRTSGVKNAEELTAVDNAIALKDTVARLITDVFTGKLNPRIASGLVPLLSLQLRAIEVANLDARLSKLEQASSRPQTG